MDGKQNARRLAWSTPELRRIEAGSAEALNKGVFSDGGTKGSNVKS